MKNQFQHNLVVRSHLLTIYQAFFTGHYAGSYNICMLLYKPGSHVAIPGSHVGVPGSHIAAPVSHVAASGSHVAASGSHRLRTLSMILAHHDQGSSHSLYM